MGRILIIVPFLFYASVTCARQPDNGQSAEAASEGVTVQSGSSGKELTDKAKQGGQGPGAGTLMDKRSQALAPQGASAGGKTGDIKQ
jgi:hypothetical protein